MSAGKNKWARTRRRKLQRLKTRVAKGDAENQRREKQKEKTKKRQKLIAKNKE